MEPDDLGGWFEAAVLVGGETILAHPVRTASAATAAYTTPPITTCASGASTSVPTAR
jgi:hypothetical protein